MRHLSRQELGWALLFVLFSAARISVKGQVPPSYPPSPTPTPWPSNWPRPSYPPPVPWATVSYPPVSPVPWATVSYPPTFNASSPLPSNGTNGTTNSTSPSPTIPPEGISIVGYVRFTGGVKNCQVVAGSLNANATTGSTGAVSLKSVAAAEVEVPVSTTCTDVFTDLPVPYTLDGDMPNPLVSTSFVVTPVTKLATFSSTYVATKTMYSYFIPQTLLPADASVLNVDALTLMQSGATKDVGARLYLTDVAVSSTCLVLGNYAFAKRVPTSATSSCATLDAVADSIMGQAYRSCSVSSPCDLTSTTVLYNFAQSALAACGAGTTNTTDLQAIVNSLATINYNLADANNDVDVLPVPVLIYGAKASKVVQTEVVTAVKSSTPASISSIVASWDAKVNSAPVNYNAILTAVGLPTLPAPVTSRGRTYSTGPVTGTTIQFKNLLDFSQVGGLATPDYVLTNGGTWGMFTIPKGGNDTFLSTASRYDMVVMTPYPSTNASASLSPAGALTTAYFLYKQASDKAQVMTSAYYNDVFRTLLGASFGVFDCSARNWASNSNYAAGVYGVDVLSTSVPNLVSNLVSGMVNGTGSQTVAASIDDMALTVYMDLARNLTDNTASGRNVFFSTSDIGVIIYNLYTRTYQGSAKTDVTVGHARRLTQASASDILDIANNYATAISSSNSLLQTQVLSAVASAIGSGSTVDVSAIITNAAKIAKVQALDIANAGSNIANLVKTGQLAAAKTAAAAAATAFSGTNLQNAVNNAVVDKSAIDAQISSNPGTNTNTTSPSPSVPVVCSDPNDPCSCPGADCGSSSNKLAIGLGVGLGVGIPVVAGLAVAAYFVIHKRRQDQATQPAAGPAGQQPQPVNESTQTPSTLGMFEVNSSPTQERIMTYYKARLTHPARNAVVPLPPSTRAADMV